MLEVKDLKNPPKKALIRLNPKIRCLLGFHEWVLINKKIIEPFPPARTYKMLALKKCRYCSKQVVDIFKETILIERESMPYKPREEQPRELEFVWGGKVPTEK